ncbi:butyrophilin subfamily 1 member A1-like isoform X1 [Acipenser oxyrinchus oxyrinchus]|uniref:Butyrophilin subfamily 1 member A1-like isoform X1 n=1 Tax=Acipenser oxyrinchus oxyrinchus TaxID=40147 RepID=A0AAD8CI73_ACIOX|nr:butyrophilin subfamily 1 member A1-like isoform X1 [Acipenser oxyrinchus oxyrinchus]
MLEQPVSIGRMLEQPAPIGRMLERGAPIGRQSRQARVPPLRLAVNVGTLCSNIAPKIESRRARGCQGGCTVCSLSDSLSQRHLKTITRDGMRGTECLMRSEGILLLLLQVYSAYADDFKVEVPVEPMSAHVGSSILLPCRISTGVSAVGMEVRWVKNGNEAVHVYVSGADLEGQQSPGFKGRTHLDKEALGAGNVSLQLNDVRVSDEGSYQCLVVSKSWFTDATMKLKVSAMGSSPRFTVAGRQDSDVTLQCDSEGWFPKPELQWRNVKGTDLTGRAVLTEKPGADGLFTLQSALQISEQEADEITCLIRHGEERRVLETRVHIGGEFFTLVAPSWKGLSVFFIVCLVLFALCISVAVYYYRKREATKEIQRQNLLAGKNYLTALFSSVSVVFLIEWKQIQSESGNLFVFIKPISHLLFVYEGISQ